MSTFYFRTNTIDFAISTKNSLYFKNKVTNIVESYGQASNIDVSRFEGIKLDTYSYENLVKIDAEFYCDSINNIDHNDCVFVGAGLSKLSGIPDMKDLWEMFFLDRPEVLLAYVRDAPSVLISRYKLFVAKLYFSSPSKDLFFLKKLQKKSNCLVITENIDNLLEKANIRYINLFKQPIEFMCPRKVFLLGVGNPYFQEHLRSWELQGTTFLAVSLNRPNINVSTLYWYQGNISDIILYSDNCISRGEI